MFESARIKLTLWYLLIIMIISILFSTVIYSLVNADYVRFERMQFRIMNEIENRPSIPEPRFVRIDPEEIQRARRNLIINLTVFNSVILLFAGAAGYFLAGRTLKPIKNTLDEQKRFISDSSHELRTPLTSLRSEIEVALRNKNLTTLESRQILESNLEEVISLQILSDRLLELAQNGKTVNKNSMKNILVKDIVDLAIKKTEVLAKAKNIKIERKVSNLKIKGIEDRLIEALVILIDNAIKYSQDNSNIYIVSKKNKNNIEISIIDNGRGISEKDLPHIFDRFYRADESRNEEGYGLGLPIAKKIIESHNGEIEVKSKLNEGSTFKIILPQVS